MPSKRRATRLTPNELAAQQIRQFHELGTRVRARAVSDQSTILVAAQDLASKDGVSYDRARKAARFATLFDDKSLEQLDRLCKTYPLTINHIRRVLGLNSKTARERWLKRAATNRWPSERLKREIVVATGRKHGAGGPKMRLPADAVEAIEQVIRRTEDWLKRYGASWGLDVTWSRAAEITDPADLARRLAESRRMLKRLLDGTKALEERLARLERAVTRKSK